MAETKKKKEAKKAAPTKGPVPYLRDPATCTARFRLTFTESLLGTSPGDPDIYRSFLAKRAEQDAIKAGIPLEEIRRNTEEEAEALEEVAAKGKTVFPRDETGNPYIYDYQVRGYFKSSCQALKKTDRSLSSGVRAYKKAVDQSFFIEERRIPIHFDGQIGECQRPLRASTPQGERISISVSEEIPAGAWIEFTAKTFSEADMNMVREWLCYGQYNGLLQWRNGGHGRFYWEELDDGGNVIGGNKGDVVGA